MAWQNTALQVVLGNGVGWKLGVVKNERDERWGPEPKEGGHTKEIQTEFSAREAVGRDVDAVLWKADAYNFSTDPDAQKEGLCYNSNGEEIVRFYF